MKKHLIKKGLALAVIILFTCISVNPSSAFNNPIKSSVLVFNGNTLYVGGNGTGNYTRIQDAIDNASVGDTVFVYDDSSPYIEIIFVNESIKLQGENMSTTIIEGSVIIGSDYVIITGFTIYKWGPASVEIDGFSNNIIENCIFNYTYIGVQLLEKSKNNIIRNCSFRHCEFVCLQIKASNNNEISYCDFFDNLGDLGFPAAIFISTSRGIKIHHCNITSNYPCGVWLRFSDIQLTSNNIFNNSGPGLEIFGAFSFCDSRYNWWGSPQGPNISIETPWGDWSPVNNRKIDNSDIVLFFGLRSFIGITRLRPWLSEPVVDAGQQV